MGAISFGDGRPITIKQRRDPTPGELETLDLDDLIKLRFDPVVESQEGDDR